MTFNALTDIAIGLMTMYLVLSLVCTSVNETIASAFKLRAGKLRKTLDEIINDPDFKQIFDRHGLIVASSPGGAAPSYLSGPTFALAVLDSLTPTSAASFAQIQAAAQALPPSRIKDLILGNLLTAGDDLQTLRTNLAKSFDSTMERLSGVYSRQLKWISLAVGLALAAALNADTIAVSKALWEERTSEQVTELARTIVSKGLQDVLPTAKAGDELDKHLKTASENIDKARDMLRPLPLGWNVDWKKASRGWSEWIALKVAGLVLTGIALMLGAPFWFDTLSKFMRVRGTGDKPKPTT
jgi:hypothetical protein